MSEKLPNDAGLDIVLSPNDVQYGLIRRVGRGVGMTVLFVLTGGIIGGTAVAINWANKQVPHWAREVTNDIDRSSGMTPDNGQASPLATVTPGSYPTPSPEISSPEPGASAAETATPASTSISSAP